MQLKRNLTQQLKFQPFRAYANLRQSSLDGLTGRGTSAFSTGAFTRPRPSSSETNLRKLAMGDISNRPGSALGLLQGLYSTRYLFGTLLDFSVSFFVFEARLKLVFV